MQKLCIDSPTVSIPNPHFAHSFHTIPNSAYKFTTKMEAACTSETLFHICQTTRRYVAEKIEIFTFMYRHDQGHHSSHCQPCIQTRSPVH